MGSRNSLRFGCRIPSQIPSSGGAHSAWRHGSGHLYQLRLVVRAGPRADAAAVETVTTVLLLLGLRWLPKRVQESAPAGTIAEHHPMVSRPRLRHCGRCRIGNGDARLRRYDEPAAGEHRGLLCRERLYARRRHQHRQCHPGGLPRVRHVRRDHGARHRRNHCLCACCGGFAPLPKAFRFRNNSGRKTSTTRRIPTV